MTDTPEYSVVRNVGRVELRRYAPFIVAEVDVEAGDLREAASVGFRPLADYIFGNNAPRDTIEMTAPVTAAPAEADARSGGKIAMTAPVTASPSADGLFTVRFSMPHRWTIETLPEPADDRVRLVTVAAQTTLARRYRGRTDSSRMERGSAELVAAAPACDVVPTGQPYWAGYSAPYVPVPARKWEMLLDVEAAGARS